ncbi:MAG TPA: hypothetical protein VHM92_08565 [Allosphingosinicella sp.]|nr:hypothetical protein [Allosphingosinicella sp.]
MGRNILCGQVRRSPGAATIAHPTGILPNRAETGFCAGQLPGLLVDQELDLERERREVRRGGAEEAAEGGEAGGFEIAEALLDRLAGGKGAALGGQALDLGLEGGEAGAGAMEGGEGAVPAAAQGAGFGEGTCTRTCPR